MGKDIEAEMLQYLVDLKNMDSFKVLESKQFKIFKLKFLQLYWDVINI